LQSAFKQWQMHLKHCVAKTRLRELLANCDR